MVAEEGNQSRLVTLEPVNCLLSQLESVVAGNEEREPALTFQQAEGIDASAEGIGHGNLLGKVEETCRVGRTESSGQVSGWNDEAVDRVEEQVPKGG